MNQTALERKLRQDATQLRLDDDGKLQARITAAVANTAMATADRNRRWQPLRLHTAAAISLPAIAALLLLLSYQADTPTQPLHHNTAAQATADSIPALRQVEQQLASNEQALLQEWQRIDQDWQRTKNILLPAAMMK